MRRRNSLILLGLGFVGYLHGIIGLIYLLSLLLISRITASSSFPKLFCIIICIILFLFRDYPVIKEYIENKQNPIHSLNNQNPLNLLNNFIDSICYFFGIIIMKFLSPFAIIINELDNNLRENLFFGDRLHKGPYALPSVIRFLIIKFISYHIDSSFSKESAKSLADQSAGRESMLLARLRILESKRHSRINSLQSTSSEEAIRPSKMNIGGLTSDYVFIEKDPQNTQQLRKRNANIVNDDNEIEIRPRKSKEISTEESSQIDRRVLNDATIIITLLEALTEKPTHSSLLYSELVSINDANTKEERRRFEEIARDRETQRILLKLLIPRFSYWNYLAYTIIF